MGARPVPGWPHDTALVDAWPASLRVHRGSESRRARHPGSKYPTTCSPQARASGGRGRGPVQKGVAVRASFGHHARGTHVTKVLVVDDEPNLVDLVKGYLEHEGFDVVVARDGPSAVEGARSRGPALIVLDLMLPGFDGLEVCRRVRQFSDAYILMLTARAEEIDRIIGLEVGADDYLTKPFSPRELIARVKAMLRRPRSALPTPPDMPPPLSFGKLTIDESRHEVTLRGQAVPLTPREFSLLVTLAAQPGRVFTRAQLLERVWGAEYYDDHVVDVHVANLRHKLGDDAGQAGLVQTVRGVGYRFSSPAPGRVPDG